MRLSEVCEAIDNKLDTTATSDLSQAALAKLVWILTRVKPCTPVSRLRVKTYAAMNARFRIQHNKIKEAHEAMEQTVAALRQEPLLSDDFVNAMAANEGFNDEWMTISETRPKTNPKAPHVPDPNQMQLPDMLAVVPKLPPQGPPAMSKAAPPPAARVAIGKALPAVPLAPLATAGVAAAAAGAPPPNAIPVPTPPVAVAAESAPPPNAIPVPTPPVGVAAESASPLNAILVPTPPVAVAVENGDQANGDGMVATAAAESHVAAMANHAVADGDGAMEAVNAALSGASDNSKVCVICYQALTASWSNGELLALTCGHVFHSMCLEKTWTIGQHPRGWCPFRCPVVHDDPDFVDLGNMEAAAGSMDDVAAAAAAAGSRDDVAAAAAAAEDMVL